MKIILYDTSTGQIVGRMRSAYVAASQIPPGCWWLEGWTESPERFLVDVSEPNPVARRLIPKENYVPSPPTSYEINAVRDRLEQAPLTVDGVRWDYDTSARERMLRAIAHWNVLTHTRVGDRIGWKDADNQVHLLTLADLVALQDALEEASAVRADALHAYARGLGERLPNLTHAALDPSGWPVG